MQIANPEKLDAIFVAIGGGGLIAGIAAYVKALHPRIKVSGSRPLGAGRHLGNVLPLQALGSYAMPPALCLRICPCCTSVCHHKLGMPPCIEHTALAWLSMARTCCRHQVLAGLLNLCCCRSLVWSL
jgi:hypothetical protein